MFERIKSSIVKSLGGYAEVFATRRHSATLGTEELLFGYSKFPWIRALSDKIGLGIGSTEWQLSVNEIEVPENALLTLLKKPNPVMSGKAFFKLSGTQFVLVNEIFWLIERNGLGTPIELWPIPAHWVKNIPAPGIEGGEYEVSYSGWRTKFRAEDIIYIRDFNPADPYGRSSSPAKALGDEIESDEFAAKFVKSFFLNNARPDLLIFSADEKNPIGPEDAKRLETKWLAKLQGVMKRHRPFFLPNKVEIKELQSDLKSMDLVDQRKFWRDMTLQVYGIPPEALGVLDSSNRATITSAEFFLTKHVIVPRVEIIMDSMQMQLVPQFDERLTLGFVSPVEEDREFKKEIYDKHPWVFKGDEIRKLAGDEPLENGEGQIYASAFNQVFSDTPGGGGTSGIVSPKSVVRTISGDELVEITTVGDSVKGITRWFNPKTNQIKERDETKIIPETWWYWNILGKIPLFLTDEYVDRLIGSGLLPARTVKVGDDDIDDIVNSLGPDAFAPGVAQSNSATVDSFGQSLIDQVEVGSEFNLSSPKVQEFIQTQSTDRIKDLINLTTRDALRKTLAEGVAEGEGAAQLAKRITGVFDQARGVRAFKIARTESVRAANFGSLEGMHQVGIRQKKWLTVGDSNVRSTHIELNGKIVGANNAFQNTSGSAQYPGDFGIAGEDIECRCSILAIIPEAEGFREVDTKTFEQDRLPFERLMENAYVQGFDNQEIIVLDILRSIS